MRSLEWGHEFRSVGLIPLSCLVRLGNPRLKKEALGGVSKQVPSVLCKPHISLHLLLSLTELALKRENPVSAPHFLFKVFPGKG